MTRIRTVLGLLSAFLVSIWFQPQASAGPFPLTVKVGYADNIHCPDFNTNPLLCLTAVNSSFPSPWQGSAGVTFMGLGITTPASIAAGAPPGFDAGALWLDNTSGADVIVGGVTVIIGGAGFPLWLNSFTLHSGDSAILTQTAFDSMLNPNFDTSDLTGYNGGISNGVIPQIFITTTVGGQTTNTTLSDTKQILNTGGFDLGCKPTNPPLPADCLSVNESSPWQLIGSQTATPEPASILLLGSGLLSLGTFVRRKMRA
jgi:hypothetical protein